MTTIGELFQQLENLLELIIKAQTNYKKCPKSRKTRGYLQTKIQCVEEYWSSFRTAHQQLLKITTREDRDTMPYFVNDVHSQCEDNFMCLKADMTDYLYQFSSSAATSAPSTSAYPLEKSVPEVKLPQINLPTFSGAYEEWQSFEDTFTSLIHNNKGIGDVQKLHYLKACVIGEAKNTIKHFHVTEKNYVPAWDNLKNRYSQKRLIVNSILKRLFTCKKIFMQSSSQLKALIDHTKECINSLNALSINTDSWDPIIIFLVVQKLDQESHKAWETYVSGEFSEDMPSFTNFTTFLESRICTLELLMPTTMPRDKIRERSHVAAAAVVQHTCIMCKENHLLYHCKQFGKMDPEKRSEYAKENRLCYNCLLAGHSVFYCKQKISCRLCGKRHHSLLHSFKKKEESTDKEEYKEPTGISSMHANVEDQTEDIHDIVTIASHFVTNRKKSLLATAVVPVRSGSGEITVLRALIDLGSEESFVSERAAQLLQLSKTSINGTVMGVGSTQTSVSHVTQLEVLSRYEENFSLEVEAYVLSKHVTTKLPCKTIMPMKWSHLNGLKLADPEYYVQARVDMLLGVEVYAEIVKGKVIKGPPGSPCAQDTSLGWILFGKVKEQSYNGTIVMHHHLDKIDIHNMLRNMWDIEETDKRNLTAEERLCEEIYASNQSRTSDGRYVVKLPFKSAQPMEAIGETREKVLRRFKQLERRLENNLKLKEEYTRVIEEYLELKHMEEVPELERNKPAVYLPHHAVVRNDKETTKVRVVFDGSSKGSHGKSLNDELLVGPQLQKDLRNLIMRWIMKPVCFISDIQKMYRQILVMKEDADFQRILWRKNIDEDIKEYRILRVTFGTSSAPYLAVRTLMKLAEDETTDHPEIAKIIHEDFFVDDCMSGSMETTGKEAIRLSKELTAVLEKGGFVLQKWASNSIDFMNEITPSLRSANATKSIHNQCIIKTLGLTWNVANDSLHINCELLPQSDEITKRSILADIQRVFDPLGWISPAIVIAKMLIQQLWVQRLDWDENLNDTLTKEWLTLRSSFKYLHKIEIDRWIKTDSDDITKLTLHGFCDASTKAYCAVVYYRVETETGDIKTGIVASKTRVAPVKPVSLPRLELCGATLLAKLLTQIREAMRVPISQVYAWTDSSVVLSWLFGDPNRWKPFVSNRVVEIIDNVTNTQWFHVSSKSNPADIGSRGRELQHLIESKLWWDGPDWLKHRGMIFPRPNIIPTDIEQKRTIQVNLKIENKERKICFEDYDSVQELLRIIVHSIRFINSKRNREILNTEITTIELEDALLKCIKIAQKEEFGEDIVMLEKKGTVRSNSKLKTLNPYLDERHILRVGGRLRNSDLEEDKKHPIILGTKNSLTNLIIAEAHKKTLHGGIQFMICYLRTKYWILRAKNAVKACVHKCIICAKQKAKSRTQIMGDLPKVRTTQARPFLHSGVDFAGPLQVLMSKGRGARSNKSYIAIFICMATKAVHLELVGDLTSESFIGAFQRFVARRGKCTHIWSDQGRNFVGANKELLAAWKQASLELPGHLTEILASDGTQWHFIPPYSPNFGGLWEAGVKSIKYHLRRILTASLTFEEMSTTLCQIEACLNSRPLTPIESSDADAIEPLTPGHFLIGEAPVTIPSPDLRDVNVTRLSRWQHTQRLVRDFWHRWQTEYLSRLQERPKAWIKRGREFDIGDIVLLKDEQLPPGKWSLGRVVEKHAGNDGITRVYSVKCGDHVLRRSVSKLCALPIDKT